MLKCVRMVVTEGVGTVVCGSSSIKQLTSSIQSVRGEMPSRPLFQTLPLGP